MRYENISKQNDLVAFCKSVAGAEIVGFDTEFVSEDTYRPDLCLIQVAVKDRLAVIDTQAVEDVTPFWELLASNVGETIVHAGREELRFCLHSIGKAPHNLVDVQIAAGLVGLEYPASYGSLVDRTLRKSLNKGETRTDWRRRPLSDRQLEYAIQDVEYLEPVRDELMSRLDQLGRREWLATEMQVWQDRIEQAETDERWRRVSGTSGLNSQQLAIVRELWRWRERQAEQRNRPVKRTLRDDLIVELARRQSSDVKRIRALRGLERRDLKPHHEAFAACVETALNLPKSDLPKRPQKNNTPQLTLLGQFLSTALASICRTAHVAPSIVGTVQDVRDLIAYHLNINGAQAGDPPALALGWRAEVVGNVINDLLSGDLSIRITDPLSDHPLSFEASDEL